VVALGIKDIIICGHSHCGAMKGLLQPDAVASLPTLSSWLSHAETTRRIVRDNYGHLEGDRLVTATVEENVLVQLENLRTLPAVASRLVRGDLHLHGWVYKIETGEVFGFDTMSGQFVPVAQYTFQPSEAAIRRRSLTTI
jgi:carbonic anhydrase